MVSGQAQNDLKSHDPIFASCLFPKQGVYFSRWGPPDRYLKPQFSLHGAMSDYANRNFLIRQQDGRKQESPDEETCGCSLRRIKNLRFYEAVAAWWLRP